MTADEHESGAAQQRQAELRAIRDRKGDVRIVPDVEGRYRALGPASRDPFANWLTPVEEHYVLHRHDTPAIDADSWTVSLRGDVDDAELGVEDLRSEYPTVAVPHTMECAGNCRAFFEPKASNVDWEVDGASTAFWTGVPLQSVLDAHGAASADGTWLTAIGGDTATDGDVFARSIPMAKARADCILAFGMNGQPLPEEHGFPVRLLVPGWYGVNSVKWLDELRVMDKMVCGPEWDERRDGEDYYTQWQQRNYRIVPEGEEPSPNESISEFDTWEQLVGDEVAHPYTYDVNVKSVIGYPDEGAEVTPRRDGTVEVLGVAWAGDDEVTTVEVSADGGETWSGARFMEPHFPNAWRLFRFCWEPAPGTYELLSRATDDRGRTQPASIGDPEDGFDALDDDEYPWNQGGYAANAYEPLGVSVTVEKSE
ncbi:sulfite oxidase [Haloarculaceae archaeon H-GB2-1]|nr:sulfite oxidase [Haloarculaceae archaeon H-GB1-1]MEA5387925.1 sulfite oxidase [Haloarculaceae archaeon H-GB11]MEA5409419.1 sulfite oxidase [Haloarculaceae archaeon H-GB2-1]